MKKGTKGQVSRHVLGPPGKLYALVSDVARMGELSPECRHCEWIDGATGPVVGARFKGTSKRGLVRWSTTPRVVTADEGREFARVVVTTGPAVDPGSIAAPANAHVVRFVAHGDLFPHASLVITHAGLGTVMTALSHGIPLLCVPMGRDQLFNAERVSQLGAGRIVGPDSDAGMVKESGV